MSSSKNKARFLSVLILLAMVFSFANFSPAHAVGGIVVNSDADTVGTDSFCTLREAIDNANSDNDTTSGDCAAGAGADSITFADDYTITLGSQLPAVTSEMTITGSGAANTIIQANAAANTATYRVFEVTSTGNLTLDGVTVRHGSCSGACGGFGGGIYILGGGTLTVTNSTLSGNSDYAFGGGIYNRGTLTVTNSTLSGNSAGGFGGGIYNQDGTLTVTNSTLSGNSADAFGGGIYNIGGMLNVARSLVSGNSAGVEGNEVSSNFGTATADAFNVFGHSGQTNVDAFGAVGFTPGASDFNATSDGGTPTALAAILDTTLADNGGPTQTHALVAGSPAIDFAGACGLATDQRGVARPLGACDAGAFEWVVTNQPPTADAGGPYLVAVNASIAFDGSGSSDPDGDSLTETWSVDGVTISGYVYTTGNEAGIFDVCLTVNDGTVNSEPDCTIVVVYNPSGGFVTGGGWIDSPAGAYTANPDLTGKATFGFVAKYKKGANVPDGNTSFAFDLAGLAFYSDSYEWLVVNQGGTNAQFMGSGTVNGALDPNGNPYKFMLWAGDGSPDTFRIKIWSEDANGIETVVYDNGFEGSGYETGQPIGAGNIVVHKGK